MDSLKSTSCVLEIGPGMGVLTKYLITKTDKLKLIEIDPESVEFLSGTFPELQKDIIQANFLKVKPDEIYNRQFSIIGNFPYNISSQIFFWVIANREIIPEVVGMIQKEVAERLVSPPGNKTYGILSVILGAFYEMEILFFVSENVFTPPPRVKSAVIRLTRKENYHLDCDEKFFFNVVKTAFNQRRKTLRNSLKCFWKNKLETDQLPIFKQRPEQLDLEGFIELTKILH